MCRACVVKIFKNLLKEVKAINTMEIGAVFVTS